ncbi:MAG: hypothetical protein IKI37_10090 [Oscillospiraceae bacterium]|nr:hypothetical protein [Oscillospiraceae bacterium]
MNIFPVVGNDFFKAFTGKYQSVFADCLEIIYNSYRTELSYGIEKETLLIQLTDYFEKSNVTEIRFDDETETFSDSRTKASEFLRKLKKYGWIEGEFGRDRKERIIMPNHSVIMMQALSEISKDKEMEYQSEISAIYSLLTNETLYDRPYQQIIKPVYDRTLSLFTGLKKLNTNIKKYINKLTDNQPLEELLENFFEYNEKIGSKSYYRMQTSDNVFRFRNTIESRLQDILRNPDVMERAVLGYQNIEEENDRQEADDKLREMITNVIDSFNSYEELEQEIRTKHSKYLKSAVNRAKLTLLNSNNIEGKISTVLRYLANVLENQPEFGLYDDIPEDVCQIFNMFPQNFISGESLHTVSISKKIDNVEEIFTPQKMTEDEIIQRREALKKKNEQKFSRKKITAYVMELLKDRQSIHASEIEMHTKRDMVRLIFISMYGKNKRSDYIVVPKNTVIQKNGFTFNDFELKRRVK